MKTIILAAGYATRMYPLTERRAKPLLDVGGKPILDWLFEDLASATDEFILVSNHRFYPDFVSWAEGKKVRVLDDGTTSNETRLGAVRDMLLAAEGIQEETLVIAGDNLLEFSLVPFIRFARIRGCSCVMCHEERNIQALRKTAVISVDAEGRITGYQEKPENPAGHLAVPPFYWFIPQDLRRLGEALQDGCPADSPGSFAAWLSRRAPMCAWVMPGRRFDVGSLQSYEEIRESYHGPFSDGLSG